MRAGAVVLGVLVVSCTPAPAPLKPVRPHPYFPIAPGDTHGSFQCVSCHALTNTNFSQFECINCHEQRGTAAKHLEISEPVVGYTYASAACYACHPSRRGVFDPTQSVPVTTLVPTWSGPTILSVTPNDEALPMRMNHGSPLPDGARDSCANCHVNAALGEFYPGQLHGSLQTLALPQPPLCQGCHGASIPAGFSGALGTGPFRAPDTGEMKHDAVAWANGAPTTTRVVPVECSTCHVAPSLDSGATWKPTPFFHVAPASSDGAT